jgi:hypothetical protein
MLFRQRPLLQQEATVPIENKDGEGPVQSSVKVRLQFIAHPDFAIHTINKNQLLCHHMVFSDSLPTTSG